MVKIKTSIPAHFGITTLTSSGKITYDNKGIAEVDDKIARELIKKFDFISLSDGCELPDAEGKNSIDPSKIEELIRENHQLKGAVSQLKSLNESLKFENDTLKSNIPEVIEEDIKKVEEIFEEDSKEIVNEFVEIINKTGKTDLQEDAKKAGYAKSKWKDLDIKELRKYMIGKLKE